MQLGANIFSATKYPVHNSLVFEPYISLRMSKWSDSCAHTIKRKTQKTTPTFHEKGRQSIQIMNFARTLLSGLDTFSSRNSICP